MHIETAIQELKISGLDSLDLCGPDGRVEAVLVTPKKMYQENPWLWDRPLANKRSRKQRKARQAMRLAEEARKREAQKARNRRANRPKSKSDRLFIQSRV